MPNILNDQQVQNAKYWYEKIPYTFLGNFNVGINAPVFQVNNVSSASGGQKMVILSDFAPTRLSNFDLVVNSMGSSRSLVTNAYPGALTPTEKRVGSGARSTGFLNLTVQNNSGVAVTGYALNYAAAVKQLTTADRILRNLPMSARDEQLAHQFDIGDGGLRPIDLETTLDRVFWSQAFDTQEYAYEIPAEATLITPVLNEQTNSDEVLIITRIGLAATAGNGVTLNIDRDQNLGYVSVLADNTTTTVPLTTWIPVNERFSVTLTATTTTPVVDVFIEVLRLRRTLLMKMMFGLVDTATLQGKQREMWDQIEAGVLV